VKFNQYIYKGEKMNKRKVLNVGGNSKKIPLPPQYENFEHLLLDIDPLVEPDILCDARNLNQVKPNQFDVIYCSHNLEHYYAHDVKNVLSGFKHVLKVGGMVHIIVPDLMGVMKDTVERNLDVDDILYTSVAGPILVKDVIYGFGKQIEASGVEFFAHKTGFTEKSLVKALLVQGFCGIHSMAGGYSTTAVGFKDEVDAELFQLFNLQ
jgi:hypothetical protein